MPSSEDTRDLTHLYPHLMLIFTGLWQVAFYISNTSIYHKGSTFVSVGDFGNNLGDFKRQVQKSDQINSDRQLGSDQLGSTRIDSDHLGS